MKTKDESLALMHEWVQSESLRKHMYAVEAAMRAYAKKYGGDEELWGITGLLHDFDYERFPQYNPEQQSGHPYEGIKILREQGYPEEMLNAILGHALYSGVPRTTDMAKCLFASDELCGFLVACAYLRPEKFATLNVDSVKKKLKDKSFAAKVNRDDIELGVAELGVEKDVHIQFVIEALRPIQSEIFN